MNSEVARTGSGFPTLSAANDSALPALRPHHRRGHQPHEGDQIDDAAGRGCDLQVVVAHPDEEDAEEAQQTERQRDDDNGVELLPGNHSVGGGVAGRVRHGHSDHTPFRLIVHDTRSYETRYIIIYYFCLNSILDPCTGLVLNQPSTTTPNPP